MRILLLYTFILASALPLSGAYKLIRGPLPGDPMKAHIYELDNGLKVYLSENREEPKFFAEVSVRAGGVNDPAANTGLAHYLEHLMFKGNTKLGSKDWEKEKLHIDRITQLYERRFKEKDPEKRAALFEEINAESRKAAEFAIPNELDRIVKELGATSTNAGTSNDYTIYFFEFPSNRIEQWAMLESNRFIEPVFRLFLPELEVVYEEKNRSLDNKDRLVIEKLFATQYPDHPYGTQSVLGQVEHLKNPSIRAIHDFFNTYYVANNMALCLSGDFEIEETIAVIDRYFSRWKSGQIPPAPPYAQPLTENRSAELFYPGMEVVYIGFSTQPLAHEDVEALKLIDMILDNAQAGLINLNLNQKQRVLRAGSFPLFRKYAGAQYLFGSPKEGQALEAVEELLLEQVDILKRGDFGDWLTPAILADFKKNEKLALESNRARVGMLSNAFRSELDWSYLIGEISRMEALTREEIIRVANKYFDGPYLTVYRRDGEFEPPKVPKPLFDQPDVQAFHTSAYGREVLSKEVTPIAPEFVEAGKDFQVVTIRDGIRLFYSRNPVNDLFSLSMGFEMGRLENRKLAVAGSLMDKAGTKDLSPEALKRAWYAQGSEFSFSVEDHNTSISIKGLDENFQEALQLMQEFVREPVSSREILDDLKAIILKQRDDAKKDIRSVYLALRNYQRFQEDSPFLTRLTRDEIFALQQDELLDLVASLPTYEHDYFYIGALPLEEVKKKIAQYYPSASGLKSPPPRRLQDIREPGQTEIAFFHKESAQARIRIEFADGRYSEDDRLEVELFNDYFSGGMSGIVFQELRESRALAYSVGAFYFQPSNLWDENLVLGDIATQPDKAAEALAAFLDLFDNMPQSEGRFQNTLRSLENQYRVSKINFRGILGAVRNWDRLALEADPRRNRFEDILTAEFPTLLDFQRKRIAGRPRLISIVGPRDRIDLARIEQFGQIREVTVEDIFLD